MPGKSHHFLASAYGLLVHQLSIYVIIVVIWCPRFSGTKVTCGLFREPPSALLSLASPQNAHLHLFHHILSEMLENYPCERLERWSSRFLKY